MASARSTRSDLALAGSYRNAGPSRRQAFSQLRCIFPVVPSRLKDSHVAFIGLARPSALAEIPVSVALCKREASETYLAFVYARVADERHARHQAVGCESERGRDGSQYSASLPDLVSDHAGEADGHKRHSQIFT